MQSKTTKDNAVIRFSAEVVKIQTTSDGGIRIVLDLPETAIDTAKKLMEARQAGAILEIAAIPIGNYGTP
jgi:hypothetical protein